MLCWSSVLLPWWPVPGCLPAWLALLKPELLQISLPAAWSQREQNSAFMFSMVTKFLWLDSVLKVFPNLNDTTNLWQSVKVVMNSSIFCLVLGSPTASLCGLGKAMWFYLFLHPTLFLCLYPVNENICSQTLRCVGELFSFHFFNFLYCQWFIWKVGSFKLLESTSIFALLSGQSLFEDFIFFRSCACRNPHIVYNWVKGWIELFSCQTIKWFSF